MQLLNLRKSLEEMTEEEIREELRLIRHRREVSRPALQKHQKTTAKKSKAVKQSSKLLSGMSPEQIQELISNLEGKINEG